MVNYRGSVEDNKDLKMFGFFTLAMTCMVLLVG